MYAIWLGVLKIKLQLLQKSKILFLHSN